MKYKVKKSNLSGKVTIPGSKSHTVRALVFALLAKGTSVIESPLDSSDTRSCMKMIEHFGASVNIKENEWIVEGIGSDLKAPDDVIDIGNSGTSLYIGMGVASVIDGYTVFTGDHQIRNRPMGPLGQSIIDLGGSALSTRNNGKPPIVIGGPITGGDTEIEAVTSQYLTSLLMAAPLGRNDTNIRLTLLNEQPYVTMTLDWLDKLGIQYKNNDYKEFHVPGNQTYKPFKGPVAADFSSATFFLVAAAVTGSELSLEGLDFNDTQGDKEVVNILKEMGADITIKEREIVIKGKVLKGGAFDLNAIPDALPALAVAGCFAEGETRLENVFQARLKETDRITVMCEELKKMGADITELEDGLVVRKSNLKGTSVHGHDDHRVIMALSVAGLIADGETVIDTAESVAVTFPTFYTLMKGINADISKEGE